jgi:hypothetical protein
MTDYGMSALRHVSAAPRMFAYGPDGHHRGWKLSWSLDCCAGNAPWRPTFSSRVTEALKLQRRNDPLIGSPITEIGQAKSGPDERNLGVLEEPVNRIANATEQQAGFGCACRSQTLGACGADCPSKRAQEQFEVFKV